MTSKNAQSRISSKIDRGIIKGLEKVEDCSTPLGPPFLGKEEIPKEAIKTPKGNQIEGCRM